MGVLRAVTSVAGSVVATAIGGGIVVVLVVLMFGGGIYRTECVLDNGIHTKGWELGGSIPYMWNPDPRHCQAHTLTRYVSGKVGVMKDLDQ